MGWLSSTRRRIGLALLLLFAVGAVSTVAFGDRDPDRFGARSPNELAELLVDGGGGKVLVGKDGKPVLGPDGKPLRVAPDGTLLDSQGRPLLGKDGKPVKLGPGNRLPRELRGRTGGGRGREPHSRRPRRRLARDGSPVVVGVPFQDMALGTAFAARYGLTVQAADGGPQAQAVADHINATGGVRGRPLELRTYRYDLYGGRPYDATWQELCSFFTSGPRPVAVIPAGEFRSGQDLAGCLESSGIPVIASFTSSPSTDFFAGHAGGFFAPGAMAMDRMARPYVRSLDEAGFFDRGARVGVIRIDHPDYNVAWAQMRDALSAAGANVVAEYVHQPTRSAGDAPGAIALIGNAVVRFRALGVDRVVTLDYAGALTFLFMQAAEPQAYRPIHAISTLSAPNLLRANVAPRQLHGAVGIGWSPLTDVPAELEGPVPPTRARCADIYARAGIALGDRSPWGQYGAYSVCDSLLALRRALERNAGSLRAGVESLGSSHPSALTMGTRLDAGHHDGAASYRALRYDTGCDCFRYVGGERGVP